MQKLTHIWKNTPGAWGKGSTLFLGKIPVGRVAFSSLLPRNAPARWETHCQLPGLKKQTLGAAENEAEARKLVVAAVEQWLFSAGIDANLQG